MATRHVYISRGRCLRFSSAQLGNTYMLYVFDMTTDQGHILEQARSDIENWL